MLATLVVCDGQPTRMESGGETSIVGEILSPGRAAIVPEIATHGSGRRCRVTTVQVCRRTARASSESEEAQGRCRLLLAVASERADGRQERSRPISKMRAFGFTGR